MGAAVAALGCSAPKVPPPPPGPPALTRPEMALPSELDVAFRLDLSKVRRSLGKSALLRLRQRAAERVGRQPEQERMVGDLLLQSDVVLIALRPAREARLLDHVFVFRGRMKSFDPRSYALSPKFGGGRDLGRDLRRFDRQSPERGQPARVYVAGTDTVVLVSEAALDSVERRLEEGNFDEHLEPPAKGLLSVAARGPALASWVEDRSTRLSGLLLATREIQGHADLDASTFTAQVNLKLSDSERATLLADALRDLVEAMRQLAPGYVPAGPGLNIKAVGKQVVVDLRMPVEKLSELMETRVKQDR